MLLLSKEFKAVRSLAAFFLLWIKTLCHWTLLSNFLQYVDNQTEKKLPHGPPDSFHSGQALFPSGRSSYSAKIRSKVSFLILDPEVIAGTGYLIWKIFKSNFHYCTDYIVLTLVSQMIINRMSMGFYLNIWFK